MSPRFLLDTNTISILALNRSKGADKRFVETSLDRVYTSAIVYGEILFGLERRPEKTRLRDTVLPLLAEIRILDWTSKSGVTYATLRAQMEQSGKSLQPLDMLIAAHALEAGATLVTNDRAFRHVPGLEIDDWTAE
ncbi:type II toxin-antitoxin system VapC family toxin [Mesorhizobium koreense]|uniref:type II toxin-antitoxin system VapC family toxin n=1 Tax=Mesorhizobium koreense TaxID=3074855 RepID=UPI00287B8615|nr:type II toxin-antitoxin system VapC family toxin [Mesorhizobium sp. WR6]